MNKYNKLLIGGAAIIALGYVAWTVVYNVRLHEKPMVPANPSVVAPKEPQLPKVGELFTLVNNERVQVGLQPLAIDQRLDQSATDKCNDMVARNYWAHDTPEGVEPWKFIQKYIDNYYGAGENLATGFSASSDAVTGWMKSPGHRENILNPKYDHVGYAVCHSDDFNHNGNTYLVVQHLADE